MAEMRKDDTMPPGYPPQQPVRGAGHREQGRQQPGWPQLPPLSSEYPRVPLRPDMTTGYPPSAPGTPPRFAPGTGNLGRPPTPARGDPARGPRMPIGRPTRTDPTLYEWDRLSPEQQQRVLTTIGGMPRTSDRRLLRTALLALMVLVLLAALVVAVMLLRAR